MEKRKQKIKKNSKSKTLALNVTAKRIEGRHERGARNERRVDGVFIEEKGSGNIEPQLFFLFSTFIFLGKILFILALFNIFNYISSLMPSDEKLAIEILLRSLQLTARLLYFQGLK